MRAILFLAVMVFAAGPVLSNDLPRDLPDDLTVIATEVLTEPSLTEVVTVCPDQLWASHRLSPAAVLSEDCGSPRACKQQCAAGDGAACFDLARIFQDLESDVPTTIASRLFALSCASGYVAGCTNRAAGILVGRDSDPFSARPTDEAVTCAARTFIVSCQMEDAWGCAMHADDLINGVLGAQDPVAAKEAANKACKLDPDNAVGACSTAQRWVQE